MKIILELCFLFLGGLLAYRLHTIDQNVAALLVGVVVLVIWRAKWITPKRRFRPFQAPKKKGRR